MKTFYVVSEECEEEPDGWKQIAKFGSEQKALEFTNKLEKSLSKYNGLNKIYLMIEKKFNLATKKLNF